MNSGSQLSRMLYQNHLVPVLSLAGCYHLMQVRWVDQTQYPMIVVASLSAVPQSCRTPLPNQYLDCMLLAVYTHTHTPGRSRVNPERQEEEKSGHTTGRRPKAAQEGEGNRRTSRTNLHGEPDLTNTAHTPKPHDTLRRSTRGTLGTKWGTS